MDYSEFDALPLETDMVSISKDPSHDGICDMSSLEKSGEIVSARIGRLGGLRWESRIGAGCQLVTRVCLHYLGFV